MSDPDELTGRHLRETGEALRSLGAQVGRLTGWGRELADRLERGHRLLVAGNGGSAAQAQHLTAELVGRYRSERVPYPAVALHAETSSVTALLNDYGADQIFARQVCAHGSGGDVLVLLSTSGRSGNLLAAAEAAHRRGVRVWVLTGPAPNPLADLSDDAVPIAAPTAAAVQEAHLVALHLVCESFDAALGV